MLVMGVVIKFGKKLFVTRLRPNISYLITPCVMPCLVNFGFENHNCLLEKKIF